MQTKTGASRGKCEEQRCGRGRSRNIKSRPLPERKCCAGIAGASAALSLDIRTSVPCSALDLKLQLDSAITLSGAKFGSERDFGFDA